MPRKFLLLLACWAAAAAASAIALAVLKPTGVLKWTLLTIAILPAGLLLNGILEVTVRGFMSLPGMKHGTRFFEEQAKGKELSPPRAMWYAFAAILGFAVVLAISVGAASAYRSAIEFFAQDKCLDQGGRWYSTSQICEHQTR